MSKRDCDGKCSAVSCAGCSEVPLSLAKLCLTPLSSGDHLWEHEEEKADTSDIGVDVGWGEEGLKRGRELTESRQPKQGETWEIVEFF